MKRLQGKKKSEHDFAGYILSLTIEIDYAAPSEGAWFRKLFDEEQSRFYRQNTVVQSALSSPTDSLSSSPNSYKLSELALSDKDLNEDYQHFGCLVAATMSHEKTS